MLFLLRENNVQACVFHVEYNSAWDLSHHLTVDFLLFMFMFMFIFRHASKRNSCCVKIMCKYVHFM